jgi:trehalose synthase
LREEGFVPSHLTEVHIAPEPLDRFLPFLGEHQVHRAERVAGIARAQMTGRVWWNVNSTARGGGVAEMLTSLLAYTRGAGIDVRWLVISGSSEFFQVTKRIHHALHGAPGDASPLDDAARATYEETLHSNAQELLALVQPGDVVLLHDPQTAGLAPALARHGALVLWRCHVGVDEANAETDLAWAFLAPYLADVAATIFSRAAYVPQGVDFGRVEVIPPSIDPFSPKNQDLGEGESRAILARTGIIEESAKTSAPTFVRADGTPGRVDRQADIIRHGPAPAWQTPLVVQVSRWDPLKDPIGVLRGFAALVNGAAPAGAELVLAGPDVTTVSDDPEGAKTFEAVVAAWQSLPDGARARVHLVSLHMTDIEENAAIVNALQRHAAVVVQKSLREGFGLTVTEAMWKGRPVIASRIGGIQDQIVDGEHGLLLPDPSDLETFASLVRRLLSEPEFARRLGERGRERVRAQYLGIRHLIQYAKLLMSLDADRAALDERPAGAVAEHPLPIHLSEAEMASGTQEDETDDAHSARSTTRGRGNNVSR